MIWFTPLKVLSGKTYRAQRILCSTATDCAPVSHGFPGTPAALAPSAALAVYSQGACSSFQQGLLMVISMSRAKMAKPS